MIPLIIFIMLPLTDDDFVVSISFILVTIVTSQHLMISCTQCLKVHKITSNQKYKRKVNHIKTVHKNIVLLTNSDMKGSSQTDFHDLKYLLWHII